MIIEYLGEIISSVFTTMINKKVEKKLGQNNDDEIIQELVHMIVDISRLCDSLNDYCSSLEKLKNNYDSLVFVSKEAFGNIMMYTSQIIANLEDLEPLLRYDDSLGVYDKLGGIIYRKFSLNLIWSQIAHYAEREARIKSGQSNEYEYFPNFDYLIYGININEVSRIHNISCVASYIDKSNLFLAIPKDNPNFFNKEISCIILHTERDMTSLLSLRDRCKELIDEYMKSEKKDLLRYL